jgi:hypothetical protein
MFYKNKIEVILFKDFMSRPAASIQKKTPLQTNIYSFLPTITIKGMFPLGDPAFALFLIGSCVVVGIALSESVFASSGFTEVSCGISSFLKVLLPVVGYGLIFWLFSTI